MTTYRMQYIRKIFTLIICLLLTTGNITSKESQATKSQRDSTIIVYLKNCGIEISSNNQVEILRSGHEKFIDLFDEISSD